MELLFLIIGGIIMAFTMKDDGPKQMMYMPPADNQLIAQQAVNKSNHHTHVTTRLWKSSSRRTVGD